MKKRVLSLFMTLMLCMTSLPTTALAATDSEVGSYASTTAETDQSQASASADEAESSTEECEHDDATYIQVEGKNQHQLKCAECGYVGESEDCNFDGLGGYAQGDADGHYAKCICGNEDKSSQTAHTMMTLPTDDNKYHTYMCQMCGYVGSDAQLEEHSYDNKTGECTECGFAPVAVDENDNLYDSVTDALEEAARTGTKSVKLIQSDFATEMEDNTVIQEPVEFNHPDAIVELQMNGHTLTSDRGTTLLVEGGTLKITGDATINNTGLHELAGSAVMVSGGKLIFEDDLAAQGSIDTNNHTDKPAVYAEGGELEFNGNLDLNGSLTLAKTAKLTHGLNKGTFRAAYGYRLSVGNSTVYKSKKFYGLLAEGYTFVQNDDTSKFVNVDRYTEWAFGDVTIVEHPQHTYEPSTGEMWECACGLDCIHPDGYPGGACPVCGRPCPHYIADQSSVDRKYYCNDCKEQMLVRTNKPDGTWKFYTDYKAAIKAAEDGSKVVLLDDVALQGWSGPVISGNGKTVTLDLNGYSITGNVPVVIVGDSRSPTSCTLKVIGAGSLKGIDVSVKASLDLSEWKSGTITQVSVSDDSNYPAEEREAGLTIGPDAGTVQSLWFTNNQLGTLTNKKLSGGSYGEIYLPDFGTSIQAGSLLAEGYAFQNADGTYVEYTQELLGKSSLNNVKVVKCVHEKIENDTCVYCNMTGMRAMLGDMTYTDMDSAVTDWLEKGGQLRLYTDYNNRDGIDFSKAKSPLVINLNGHNFEKGGCMRLDGADLTIRDTAEKTGLFGILLADNGTLTLDGGALEVLNVLKDSKAEIYLHGGQFTAGGIHASVYKLLEKGYYLQKDGTSIEPLEKLVVGDTYQVRKADIAVGGDGSNLGGDIAVGKYQVPVAAIMEIGDDNVKEVMFTWYLLKDDGTTAILAGSDYVPVTDGKAAYDVNTDGSAYAQEGWKDVVQDETYDLICVVTGKTDSGEQWKTAWDDIYHMNALPPSLENAEITFNAVPSFKGGNTFVFWPDPDDHSVGWLKLPYTVTLDGTELELNKDYGSEGGDCATEIGGYTLKIFGVTGRYSGEKTIDWKVEPHQLGSIQFESGFKEYDGTDALPEGAVSSQFTSQSGYSSLINLKEGEDYEVTEAHYTSVEAGGDSKDFVVTVKLKNKNYIFDDGTTERTFTTTNSNAQFGIVKADAPAVEEAALTVMNAHEESCMVDLSALLPALDRPMEYGDVSYTIDKVDLGSYYDATKGEAKIEDGKLILPIQNVNTEKEGFIGTVTVRAGSTNVYDMTLTINVSATNKIVPKLDGTLTLSPVEITYGGLLGTIAISGTMKDGDKVVSGTFAWTDGTIKPEAGDGTYTASWKFTPADTKNYAVTTGTTKVKVNKAASTGEPVYTKITADGKTLADANLMLTGSTLNPAAGTLEWIDEAGNVLSNDTKVEANRIYKWRFTPADSNYNILTGEAELYHADKPATNVTDNSATGVTDEKTLPAVGTKLTSDDGKATYKITRSSLKNGTVTYAVTTNKKASTIVIPDTVVVSGVTYQVTAVEKNAFANNKKLKTVTIGKNVTAIGAKAFYGCKNIKTIIIKSKKLTTKKIGSKAFSKTPKKMTVKVPKNKFKAYKKMLIKRGVNKKVKFKKF